MASEGFGEEEKKATNTMEKLSQNGFEKVMREKKLDAMASPGILFYSRSQLKDTLRLLSHLGTGSFLEG